MARSPHFIGIPERREVMAVLEAGVGQPRHPQSVHRRPGGLSGKADRQKKWRCREQVEVNSPE